MTLALAVKLKLKAWLTHFYSILMIDTYTFIRFSYRIDNDLLTDRQYEIVMYGTGTDFIMSLN